MNKNKNGRHKHKERIFKLGELFCGPGGLALGALNAGLVIDNTTYKLKHVWANDYHKDSCRTFAFNITPDDPESVICEDVRKLNINNLPAIDAFSYGFPCNDYSIVGEQKGIKGTFGPLYSYGVRVIDRFKPNFFVAENVGGIKSANDGKTFKRILDDLKNSGTGYKLTVHLYKFEEYGVPQTRHRVIIVGIKNSLGKEFRVPAPTSKNCSVTAREAINTPPIHKDAPNNEQTAQSKTVIERLKHIRAGENAWNSVLPRRLRLNVKKAKLSQIYRRLDPNRPAYTITGSGGGGTHGYHWKYNRALTNRERARLQTFPDDFIFQGSKESVRKQIGMAVSPKMAEVIFSAVLKTLAGVMYPSVEPNLNYLLSIEEEPLFVSSIVKEKEFLTV